MISSHKQKHFGQIKLTTNFITPIEGLTVQKRWRYPDDVCKAVTALALGNFPYSTGQVIMVDGGLTLSRF